MARISDATQTLMRDRWAASIPKPYRYRPKWWQRQHLAARGDIIAPVPDDSVLGAFWAEFMRVKGWTE